MTRVRKHTTWTVEDDQGREFVLEYPPFDCHEPIIRRLATGGWVVGYLVLEECASNPLDDMDCEGQVVDGRGGHREQTRELRQHLHLDEYGQVWEDNPDPDPTVMLLSYREHGVGEWRLEGPAVGTDADERQKADGVWVPDKYAEREFKEAAAKEVYGITINERVRDKANGTGKKDFWTEYQYVLDGRPSGWFRRFDEVLAKALKREAIPEQAEAFDQCLTKLALARAKTAVEMYSYWANGEVFMVVVETFDRKRRTAGEDDDRCTCYGSSEAEKELEMRIEAMVKAAKKRRKERVRGQQPKAGGEEHA